VRHIENMLILLGDTPQAARDGAAAVMRIETALANASLNVVDRRDPYKV
jgi:predicted metalloendopeptidase